MSIFPETMVTNPKFQGVSLKPTLFRVVELGADAEILAEADYASAEDIPWDFDKNEVLFEVDPEADCVEFVPPMGPNPIFRETWSECTDTKELVRRFDLWVREHF